METLLQCLKELQVSDYRLVETICHSKELFFITKKLDLSRAKQVRKWTVTVYEDHDLDGKMYRGSATMQFYPTMTKTEMEAGLQQLKEMARLGRQDPYRLPSGSTVSQTLPSEVELMPDVLKMMLELPEENGISINSFEIFSQHYTRRIINSRGVDVTFYYTDHEVELVLNARNDKEEVEIYEDYRFGKPSEVVLSRAMTRAMRQAADRLQARPCTAMPEGTSIVLSGKDVVTLFSFYLNQLSAARIYQKYSHQQIGQPITEQMAVEPWQLEGLKQLENSNQNFTFDDDGRPVKDVLLVKDGIVEHFFGSHQHLSYLGIQDGTSVYNFKVSGGKLSREELEAMRYLEIVDISSFSVDPLTGDFAGEIRLAYYHDGNGQTTAYTGGSFSGNLKQMGHLMRLSQDLTKYNCAVVPEFVVLPDVNLAV